MTAEVLIMNKNGVAMAADSAATLLFWPNVYKERKVNK